MATCYALKKACKRQGERLDWAFNWTHELARKWQADVPYAVGVAVRPTDPDAQTALEYVSGGGQTGSEEPAWPTAIGETVVSGTVTFTAQALSMDSLDDVIVSSVWDSAEPSIVIDGEVQSATAGLQQTSAFVAGGVLKRTHDVVNTVTTQKRTFEGVLRLRIDP
jgi:hypothetical protein